MLTASLPLNIGKGPSKGNLILPNHQFSGVFCYVSFGDGNIAAWKMHHFDDIYHERSFFFNTGYVRISNICVLWMANDIHHFLFYHVVLTNGYVSHHLGRCPKSCLLGAKNIMLFFQVTQRSLAFLDNKFPCHPEIHHIPKNPDPSRSNRIFRVPIPSFSKRNVGDPIPFLGHTNGFLGYTVYVPPKTNLGGGFKHFLFSPRKLGKIPILTSIFFKWVGSTTN